MDDSSFPSLDTPVASGDQLDALCSCAMLSLCSVYVRFSGFVYNPECLWRVFFSSLSLSHSLKGKNKFLFINSVEGRKEKERLMHSSEKADFSKDRELQ